MRPFLIVSIVLCAACMLGACSKSGSSLKELTPQERVAFQLAAEMHLAEFTAVSSTRMEIAGKQSGDSIRFVSTAASEDSHGARSSIELSLIPPVREIASGWRVTLSGTWLRPDGGSEAMIAEYSVTRGTLEVELLGTTGYRASEGRR